MEAGHTGCRLYVAWRKVTQVVYGAWRQVTQVVYVAWRQVTQYMQP